MPTPVKMPRLGESVAEGTVGSWLKKEGEWVEKDESLAEIITDKINAELPSPIAGRLTKILVKAEETVPVGAHIALIEENADVSASPPAEPAPGPDAAPVETPTQATTPVIEQKSTSTGNGASEVREQSRSYSYIGEEERQRISPLARRLAREHDIDLNQIAGTGAGGRVRKEDILAYVAQGQAAPARATARVAPTISTPPTSPAPPVVPEPAYTAPAPAKAEPVPTTVGPDEELVTPSRMRLAIAEHMVRSKRTSPHAT